MTQRAEPQITLFSPENIHGVAALARQCFTTPWSEEIYRRELENPQSVGFVCTDGGNVIGMIHCNFVLDELTLNTLCVAENYRRQGIARRLWAAVCGMSEVLDGYSPESEKCKGGFMLDASIGKSINLRDGKRLSINLQVQNITNNTDMRTGGYEQNRKDRTYDYQFSKNSYYYYANAINAFLNVSLKF